MFDAKVIQIMIGAPSDTEEERKVVFEYLSIRNSKSRGYVLLPKHWESNAFSYIGENAQEVINKQVVNDNDMLICIFANKLGTPIKEYSSEHIIDKELINSTFV